MLRIHGLNNNSSEYKAAVQLARLACECIPNLEDNNSIILEIFPSIQCFGQKVQDIDLLVFFADYRDDKDKLRSNNNNPIHSFCATVEIKEHSPDSVYFEGSKCIVKYRGQPHDVTSQSEQQKYSVLQYINKNIYNGKSPYISNLIWLLRVPKSILPKTQSNILTGESSWIDFINTISLLSNKGAKAKIVTFSHKGYLDKVLDVFSRKIEPSKIDRKRLEAITKSILDRSQQQYADKLGKQLLIYRGRGGTGKTIRLIRTAYQAYNEMGYRVILLTYNKALVADIKRLLILLRVKDSVAANSISIKTIHKFMHEWLFQLGIIKINEEDFLINYEGYKKAALEYFNNEESLNKIALARKTASRELEWDLILIDESQDWPKTERDLIYKLYGFEKVIIADGVDQFVRGVDVIDWRENIDKKKTQIVPLRKSLRLKSSLCKTVGHFADEIEYSNWNLQPIPDSHGGKVILVTGNVMSEKFHKRLAATAKNDGNHEIDMLLCVPPSWVITEGGEKYSKVAKQYKKWGLKVWDAVDPEIRDDFPTSLEQYRIVQYESCRGLEGWVVVNFALDEFFDFKHSTAKISDSEKLDMFYEEETAALDYAKKWMMIPLTRAIDTLVIHVSNPNSYIGQVLMKLKEKDPDSIEVLHF